MRFECDACEGHGYAAFACDSVGHPGIEIQRCDNCQELDDDDAARLAFVGELERGIGYAQDQAEMAVKYGSEEVTA